MAPRLLFRRLSLTYLGNTMSIHFETTGVEALKKSFDGFTQNLQNELRVTQKIALKKVIADSKKIINSKVNDRHQHIAMSLFSEVSSNGLEGKVYLDKSNKLAIYHHEGTGIHGGGRGPYKIIPKNKKALYWVEGGTKHFAKSITATGIKPIKFLYKSFDKNKGRIKSDLEKIVDRVMT